MKKIKFIFLGALLFFGADVLCFRSVTLISHKTVLLEHLLQLINQEKVKITFDVFTFTHCLVAQSLVVAKNRGVCVKGVVDKNSIPIVTHGKVFYLRRHGVDVQCYRSGYKDHNKIFCFGLNGEKQEPVVWTGSANISVPGLEGKNRETVEVMYGSKEKYGIYTGICEESYRQCLQQGQRRREYQKRFRR